MATDPSEAPVKACFVDFHCHILPGLDDGPPTMAEAVNMARTLSRAGYSDVFCTPHLLKGVYDNAPGLVKNCSAALQRIVWEAGIPLCVHAGIEYYLDEFLEGALDAPLPLERNIVLIEFPTITHPDFITAAIYRIISVKSLRPLIAHPERCESLESLNGTQHPSALSLLRDMDCMFQGNLGSFAGMYGAAIRKRALKFLHLGLYDCLGSDAHNDGDLLLWLEKGVRTVELEIGRDAAERLLRPASLLEQPTAGG